MIVILRLCLKLPKEVCRKLLQYPALAPVIVMLYVAGNWTAAMAAASFVMGAAALLILSPLAWWKCVLFSLLAAPVSAGAELFTHNGNDTVSVPIAVAVILTILCMF